MNKETVYTYTEAARVVIAKIEHNNAVIKAAHDDTILLAGWLRGEGWSYRDIAKITECSYTTVFNWLKNE